MYLDFFFLTLHQHLKQKHFLANDKKLFKISINNLHTVISSMSDTLEV